MALSKDWNMEVHQIVREYLNNRGYDGLFNINGECACLLDDLAPCGEMSMHCKVGFKTETKDSFKVG